MFNLVKDDFDESPEDILNSINKILEKNKDKDKDEKNNIENKGKNK